MTVTNKHPPLLLLDGVQRPLTVAECSLLQGFPRDWKWHKYEGLGNSVPPPFMKTIAEHVRVSVLEVSNTQQCEVP